MATAAGAASRVADYADLLLASLGRPPATGPAPDPLAAAARSGTAALTGRPDGPVLAHTGPTTSVLGALRALGALAPGALLPGAGLLAERAAGVGTSRRGSTSCGGASRLLPCADGWVAVTLSRETDLELVPALVEHEVPADAWAAVSAWLLGSAGDAAVARGRLLGLPLARVGEVQAELPWVVSEVRPGRPVRRRPRVVDLTSLWAGPLAAHLLHRLGCEVVTVEDPSRPDGARRGSPAFHARLHAGARLQPLDLRSPDGRAQLHRLLLSADVALEGSRPRALQQMGLPPERLLDEADLTWVSITAHGRDAADRVGYGDDAAAAGGLVAWEQGRPLFVADAVADPLTGVHAALAAWSGLLTGGARLVDVALSRTAAAAARLAEPAPAAVRRDGAWHLPCAEGLVRVQPPGVPEPGPCS